MLMYLAILIDSDVFLVISFSGTALCEPFTHASIAYELNACLLYLTAAVVISGLNSTST
jgi:hypothetical protein